MIRSFIPALGTWLFVGSTVWVYLRDSGGLAQELSVKQEQDEVERFSARYGLIIRHIFADVARTGTTTVGRDAFNVTTSSAIPARKRSRRPRRASRLPVCCRRCPDEP